MSSIQPATPRTASRLWRSALSFARRVAGRIVVPVSSTEEMSDVWKLYRLTPRADAASNASR